MAKVYLSLDKVEKEENFNNILIIYKRHKQVLPEY